MKSLENDSLSQVLRKRRAGNLATIAESGFAVAVFTTAFRLDQLPQMNGKQTENPLIYGHATCYYIEAEHG